MEERVKAIKATPTSLKATFLVGVADNRKLKAELLCKTVNGVTTTYHYNNGILLSETTGEETLRYYYDSTGKLAELVHQKGEERKPATFLPEMPRGIS